MSKFQPSKTEKIVISIRIEDYKIQQIDKIASKIDISRNELINQCLDYALNNLEFKELNKCKDYLMNKESIELDEEEFL